jgi:hypothetical protein
MSTAAELLDPEVLVSVKAEFHDVFMQKREGVRKLRAAIQVSRSTHSGHAEHHAASKDGTFAGTKRSREGAEHAFRPLKRPRIIEDVPNISPDATREVRDRDLWENHTFVELSPTGPLQVIRKVRVREEMYEPLRAWKEVERGIAAYEYVFAQEYNPHTQSILIASMESIVFVKLIASDLAISGALYLIAMKRLPPEWVENAIQNRSIMPTFPPLNMPATLKIESPDGQSTILALNHDKANDTQVGVALFCFLLRPTHAYFIGYSRTSRFMASSQAGDQHFIH